MDETEQNIETGVVQSKTKTISLRVNPWWLCAVLVVGVVAMLFIWRPWSHTVTDRTISVSGDATINAVPDEYTFSPSYDFTDANKATALSQLSTDSNTIVAAIKKLGVADKDITTTSSGSFDYSYDETSNTYTYSLDLNIVVHTKDIAQKVQDYLVTTNPTGQVSPTGTFSDALQKKLDVQGRDKALKDAEAKAEQQAKDLGFKIGKVKSVNDNDDIPRIVQGGIMSATNTTSLNGIGIESGQNSLSYKVQVVYFIR